MQHFCRFCEKVFNRSYNRDRQEKQSCPKRFVGEEVTVPTQQRRKQKEKNEDSSREEPADEEEEDEDEQEEEEKEIDMEDESISGDVGSEANP